MVRLMCSVVSVLAVWSCVSSANETSAAYKLNPGDVVSVSVWQEENLSQDATVLPDGSIIVKLAGRLDVVGLDAAAVEQKLTAKFEKFLPDPVVTVAVKSIPGNLVYVQGKVIKPGSVQMTGPTEVLQALSMSGGLDKFADESAIKVVRRTGTKQQVLPVNYKDLVSGRDMSTNIQLQAGDTLVVP